MTTLRKTTLLAALIIAGIAGITQPTFIAWSQGDGTAEPAEPETPVPEEPSIGDETGPTEPAAAPQPQQQQQEVETFEASVPELGQQLEDKISELEAGGVPAESITIDCDFSLTPFRITCKILCDGKPCIESAGGGTPESTESN